MMRGSPNASLWVGAVWLLNPVVANISTRGSAEAVLGAIVVSTLALALSRRFDACAVGQAAQLIQVRLSYASSFSLGLHRLQCGKLKETNRAGKGKKTRSTMV